ncbi:YkvA family protein [Methanolobus sp. WCC5]|uniref:YkvA family protein n=1 Tax=Methanolobus sp. WCC5 TaxID=3125785 RepID=UPI00324F18BE
MGLIKIVLKALLKGRFYKLQLHTKTLSLASKRSDLPLYTRLFAAFVVLYILSPIDLIPGFVPVLGIIDDIILIPLGLIFVMKMIPKHIMNECRCEAQQMLECKNKAKVTAEA